MYLLPFPVASISSGYGMRALAGGTFHEGVDWPVAMNTPLPALADGVVVAVGESKKFGKYIVVQADEGGFYRWHAINAALFKVGDRVRAGQPIARSGKTGFWSTGPHGHLQCTRTLNPNSYFNPLTILSAAAGTGSSSTPFENEDDMYTDLDRARDTLTHDAVARIELKLWTLQSTATKAQASGDVAAWALTAEGVGVRQQLASLTNLVATIKGGGLTEEQLREALGASATITAEDIAERTAAKIAPDLAEVVDDILAALPQSDATPAQIADELAKRLAA